MKVALKIIKKGDKTPPGLKNIPGHWIFNLKMNLSHKKLFASGSHLVDPPQAVTYASVVSKYTLRIFMTAAALNDHDFRSFEIGNTYPNEETDDKV